MTSSKHYLLYFVSLSVVYVALAIVLFVAPETSRHIICYILAAAAALLGIFRVAWHFTKDDLSRAFHSDIPTGVVLVMAGVYIFARADLMVDWLNVLLGFTIVFDSMVKLQHAFDLKRTGFTPWWWFLLVSLLTAVLGVLLTINIFGGLLTYFFGAILIIDGVANIITIVAFSVRIKNTLENQAAPPPPPGDYITLPPSK